MRKKDDEKERNIKEAVIRLILEEGFHGASISKIAKVARVSPATVYTYFDNKENMLQDIYIEYSEEIYSNLVNSSIQSQEGKQQLEALIRSYYNYILENQEIFSFVEQFSSCPSLSSSCNGEFGICRIYRLLDEMKAKRVIKAYSEDSLMKIIFFPVKAVALEYQKSDRERELQLKEIIQMIQDAILIP